MIESEIPYINQCLTVKRVVIVTGLYSLYDKLEGEISSVMIMEKKKE